MKINDIYESTTAGSVATVAQPMTGGPQRRSNTGTGIYPAKKVGNLLSGKKTNKPYANSVNESVDGEHVTVVYIDGKPSVKYTNASDAKAAVELMKKKHPKKTFELKSEVRESQLDEEELIIVLGQGHNRKSGFIPHAEDRRDHEVSMARSDLFQAAKNAKQTFEMLEGVSEDEGIEGWVQAKITKAADYLATVREYLEGKQVQGMAEGAKVDRMVKHVEKSEEKAGKSKKEAENIAWSTANKRGMLNNKNHVKGK